MKNGNVVAFMAIMMVSFAVGYVVSEICGNKWWILFMPFAALVAWAWLCRNNPVKLSDEEDGINMADEKRCPKCKEPLVVADGCNVICCGQEWRNVRERIVEADNASEFYLPPEMGGG
ncbi:MAG: hypothetical protein WC055_16840 [Melioribacteraceae bacterium]